MNAGVSAVGWGSRILDSRGLSVRLAAARRVWNRSAAARACEGGPMNAVLSANAKMSKSGNVSARWLNIGWSGVVKRRPPKGSPCCVPVSLSTMYVRPEW